MDYDCDNPYPQKNQGHSSISPEKKTSTNSGFEHCSVDAWYKPLEMWLLMANTSYLVCP